MPDLFYFNRHFHSMQAGIPVGTFLQKMETIVPTFVPIWII